MMISLLNSVFITLLFSIWIWTLKQDIGHLNQPSPDRLDGMQKDVETSEPKLAAPAHRSDSVLFDQHGKARNKSGVATWTIA